MSDSWFTFCRKSVLNFKLCDWESHKIRQDMLCKTKTLVCSPMSCISRSPFVCCEPLLSRGSACVLVAASAEPALGYITVWCNADLSGLDWSHDCGSACSLSGFLPHINTPRRTHMPSLSLPFFADLIVATWLCSLFILTDKANKSQ